MGNVTGIETERLIIRNFQPGDGQALYELIVQYQASEYAPHDQQWPTSREEILRITEWFAGGDSYLAACLKGTGQLIGFVALSPAEGEGQCEFGIGYVFNSDYYGRGCATEACTAVLRRAFDELRADRVVTGTAAINQPSCRLLEQLGFQKSGEEFASFRTAEDGKPIRFLACRYAISRDEWKNREQQRR